MRLYRACDAGKQEEGVALVEFALVAPVLLLILIAMLDFGKVFNYWIQETNLASAGARWAVVNKQYPTTAACADGTTVPASLQQFIQCQAETAELRNGGTSSVPAKARVCIASGDPGITFANLKVGDPIKVTVRLTYRWLPMVGSTVGVGSTTVAGSSTMRLEAVPTKYSAGCYPT